MEINTLAEHKHQLQNSEFRPRAREAAKTLGISEAEYVALSYPSQAQPLDIDRLQDLLIAVQNLGEVMALTRNDSMVFEHHGSYYNPRFRHNHMILENPPIDIRLRLNDVSWGFSVNENERLSLQFFDTEGRAIHKIYLTEKSDHHAYHYLIQKYCTKFVMPSPKSSDHKGELKAQPSEQEWLEFKKRWEQMTNSHQLNPLLKSYGISRPQAYQQLVDVATQINPDSVKFTLEQLALLQVPVLIFAPNGVCTQIHNGTIDKLMETGPWLNVLDKTFHMHLNLPSVSQAWKVYKPSDQEIIESIEWFDHANQPIAMLYLHPKARKDPTMTAKWQGLLTSICKLLNKH
ncbi:hypothetical protein J3998_05665 [Thiomicrorhabdus sp. 6S2-11]|uniref:Haemin-degrading HemS/ChuX domain-containing protein n=1 Tax=Thiomicrorhabdus marina TaxID=2818442 RepID=A0ABS3Q400_9GAMM|nr:ChuX/HutX family heme-like substrate-binding protein [Thiomicrorhabdus marina]MBO1927059.1 hypothetical protein [Thiomicrorhabdus marina]